MTIKFFLIESFLCNLGNCFKDFKIIFIFMFIISIMSTTPFFIQFIFVITAFLPREAMLSAVYAVVVCLCVCLLHSGIV